MVLIAHNELGHDTEEVENATGDDARRCPLYPGMTCRDHLNVAVDIDTARDEDLVLIPFIELCPNTWLVRPDREVIRIEEKDQFVPKAIRTQVAAIQKELGPPLTEARYVELRDLLLRGDAALDEESWRLALQSWAGVLAVEKEPHAALRALLESRLTLLDEDVALIAEDLTDLDAPTPAQVAQARTLQKAIDVPVLGRRVPTWDALELWLDAYGS